MQMWSLNVISQKNQNDIYEKYHLPGIVYNWYQWDYLFRFINNSNSVAHNSEDMLCIMDSQDFHKRRDGPFIISIYFW